MYEDGGKTFVGAMSKKIGKHPNLETSICFSAEDFSFLEEGVVWFKTALIF